MRALPAHLHRNLTDPCGLAPGARLLVAVSGGADSTALLHALAQAAPRSPRILHVAHFNHRLRGADGDADADFVASIATRLGLPFHFGQAGQRGPKTGARESIEMSARRLRHAFLARTARETSADAVVLGHHADDQVELFLLRLLRGSGGGGLGGMRWTSPSPSDPGVQLCRPLLDVQRTDLHAWLTASKLPFREDASNADIVIPRNAVRHQLLPILREFAGVGIDAILLRVAELVGTDADFVSQAAIAWRTADTGNDFTALHPAVQRAVIRRQLWDLGQEASFELVERLRRLPARNASAKGNRAWRQSRGILTHAPLRAEGFRPGSRRILLADPRGRTTWHGVGIGWKMVGGGGPVGRPVPRPGNECFDAEKIGPSLEIRHWQPGDRFQPLGRKHPTKLQDLFVNRKIPAAERRERLLAVATDGPIVWVEGLPPGHQYRVTASTRHRLDWSWHRKA